MEKLLLRFFFSAKELNVIDNQHIDLTEGVSKLAKRIVLYSMNKTICERFGGQVEHLTPTILTYNLVSDCMSKMSFT